MHQTKKKIAAALIGMLAFGAAQADPILLFAAGGGGGAGYANYYGPVPGIPGQTATAGAAGLGANAGAGGTAGSGGAGATNGASDGGGGAGWLGNGGDGAGAATTAGTQGGAGRGGSSAPSWAGGIGGNLAPFAIGGYGGGGGGGWQGGGGGGGYSGGGGGSGATAAGGGGGSFIAAAVSGATATAGVNGNATLAGSGVVSTGANGFVVINGNTFSYTGAPVDYVAPTSGTYTFVVDGAQGGQGEQDLGGYGAELTGSLFLAAGTPLELVIGGGGESGNLSGYSGGGGGGGTFVYEPSSTPGPTNTPVTTGNGSYYPSNNGGPAATPSPACVTASLQAYMNLGFGGCTIGSATFYNFSNPTANAAYSVSTNPGSQTGTPYDPSQILVTPNNDPAAPALGFSSPDPYDLFSLPQGSAANYFVEYNIDPPIDLLGFGLADDPFSGNTYVQADVCTNDSFANGCTSPSTIAIDSETPSIYTPFGAGTTFADVFVTVNIDALDAASSIPSFAGAVTPAAVTTAVPEPDEFALAAIGSLALVGAGLGRKRRRTKRLVA